MIFTRRFPLKRPDGRISVIEPRPNSRFANETEEVWLERVVAKSKKETERLFGMCELLLECDQSYLNKLLKTNPILPSRQFREAWRANPDGTLRVDEVAKQKMIDVRIIS